MKCPICTKEFHPQPDGRYAYMWAEQEEDGIERGFGIAVQLCPSCQNMVLIYQEGEAYDGASGVHLTEVQSEKIVYPNSAGKILPEEVPEDYRNEYGEAYSILSFSAKASAALSRRLLQKVFQNKLGISKRNLSEEIDEFVGSSGAPTYLTEAVDAVRTVGNFAAHPIKNTNSGEIVDVEPGEAEWLLEVLEAMYDFVFVQPEKLRQRRESLNEKLKDMGKPPLKNS